VRDTVILDGDADLLLEGASVFGDLVLLAKGRKEFLEVLVAGVHYIKVVHRESKHDVAGLVTEETGVLVNWM
jgi:hypothetical protein